MRRPNKVGEVATSPLSTWSGDPVSTLVVAHRRHLLTLRKKRWVECFVSAFHHWVENYIADRFQ